MDLDDCDVIFQKALSAKTEGEFRQAIEPLWDVYEILSVKLGRGSIYWRARHIERDVYPNVVDLDYPPAAFAALGRLNDAGCPCFYVSTRRETALAEVGGTEGQLIQVAGFQISKEQPITVALIGEYANVQKCGYMRFISGPEPGGAITRILNSIPPEEAKVQIYIDLFFASILANSNAAAEGYVHSRALGAAIYSRNHAQGIAFPSVKDPGGFNLAVQAAPSDASFLNSCCMVVQMGRKRRFGLIDFDVVKSAKDVDVDWDFVWQEPFEPGFTHMYNMTKEEFEAASVDPTDSNTLLNVLQATSKG